MFEVCEEMQKYRKMLDQRGIKWEDRSDNWEEKYKDVVELKLNHWICRTHFRLENGDLISVINGAGTYGGFMYCDTQNCGLLELMCSRVNGGEPEGHLTAERAIKLIEEAYGELKNVE